MYFQRRKCWIKLKKRKIFFNKHFEVEKLCVEVSTSLRYWWNCHDSWLNRVSVFFFFVVVVLHTLVWMSMFRRPKLKIVFYCEWERNLLAVICAESECRVYSQAVANKYHVNEKNRLKHIVATIEKNVTFIQKLTQTQPSPPFYWRLCLKIYTIRTSIKRENDASRLNDLNLFIVSVLLFMFRFRFRVCLMCTIQQVN